MSMTFSIVSNDGDGYFHGECDATFNVHNSGGYAIIRAIGAVEDSCGSMPADEVLAACVAFRATEADVSHVTVPAAQGVGEGGARWVECGVDENYVRTRIGWLEELAELARAGGYEVGWC